VKYFLLQTWPRLGRVWTVAKSHHEENLSFNRPAIELDGFFGAPVEIQRGLNIHELSYALSRLTSRAQARGTKGRNSRRSRETGPDIPRSLQQFVKRRLFHIGGAYTSHCICRSPYPNIIQSVTGVELPKHRHSRAKKKTIITKLPTNVSAGGLAFAALRGGIIPTVLRGYRLYVKQSAAQGCRLLQPTPNFVIRLP
jgi:hypothetical protein